MPAFSTSDFHYYFILPMTSAGDVDKIMQIFMVDLPRKVGAAKVADVMRRGGATMEKTHEWIVMRRDDISYMPAKPRLKPEEMEYVRYDFYYIKPGMEMEVDAIANDWKAALIAANINDGFTVYQPMVGGDLPLIVVTTGGKSAADLEMQHQLLPFLQNNQMGGQPLTSKLGGWLKEAECLRGKVIVADHLNWSYFADRFGIHIANYIERRPGIPPSAAHVADLIGLMRNDKIQVLWVADYFDDNIPTLLAERTGAKFLYVPLYTGSTPATADYFGLIDAWIQAMRSGFPDCR